MSLLQKKTAIARELSIPAELDLSQSLAVAAEMVGIVVEPSATLLQVHVADQLIDLIGCKVNGAVPEAVVTPAADGAATAASSGASLTTTASSAAVSSRSSAAGKRTASGFLDASGCLDTNSKATKQKKILLSSR